MRQLLPVVTSCLTLWGMWEAGSSRARAWVIGLCNQVLWLALIISFQTWGLLILNVALVGVYTRNLVRWRREARAIQGAETTFVVIDDPAIRHDPSSWGSE